ncbi:polyphenol oxidase family protein [Senegalimassilia anaerobia]|uniref:polyphenol oxidase family protein n=1 Tax=Senegalimassilia anaerobia TaxID=1473216 RepID=UPI0026767A9D|nr:polyphenol oxidase family protein [Senegalimassilia anaerobia]
MCETLPAPKLDARPCGARRISMLTDDALFQACGVRIAFTGRDGGSSQGPFASLNLGAHVQDNLDHVMENRRLAMQALDGEGVPVIVPNQVHGTEIVFIHASDAASVVAAQQRAQAAADALVVTASNVAAMLCFADCTPVIAVSPTGRFAVAHAGWRGVVGGIAASCVKRLALEDGAKTPDEQHEIAADYNVYIGPHIHDCCFEVGSEVEQRFAELFGQGCVRPSRHVSMLDALRVQLAAVGVDPARICDAGICTQCNPQLYFSYRASGGTCGRHGAIAFRKEA